MQTKRQVRKLISTYFNDNHLKSIPEEDISITQLFSLANQVYRIDCQETASLLIKIYQSYLKEFTDNRLQTEIVTQLASQDLYPEVYRACEEYRIQKFINTFPVSNETLKQDQILIVVEKLADFSCNFKEKVASYNKNRQVQSIFQITKLQQIFWTIYNVKKGDCPQLISECQESIQAVWNNTAILNNLKQLLNSTQRVLSHNDCHLGNILLTQTNLYLLDFEFSQFNYIGFDLGNFLNEWTTDYGETFDIKEEKEMDEAMKKRMMEIYYSKLGQKYKVSKSQQDWIWYTQLGRVLSHLFWMIIGLKQIDDPRISFSMVRYIQKRREEFLKHHSILLQLTSP